MISKSLLSTKPVIAVLVVFLAFLANMKFQQYKQEKLIQKEEEKIVAQEKELQQHNKELSDSLAYFSTGDFKEKIARQQLGLKKDGETVYDFTQPAPTLAPAGDTLTPAGDESNSHKWWQYFFGTK